jgi:MFS family permease
MDVGVVALLGEVAPERETTLVGLRATVTGAGGVVGPLLVGVTASISGFQAAFALAGLLAFGGAALVARRLTEAPRSPETEGAESGVGPTERSAVTPADRTIETVVGIQRPVRVEREQSAGERSERSEGARRERI